MNCVSIPWLLDMPYVLADERPFYYGEIIKSNGLEEIRNRETGERVYVDNWQSSNRYKSDFEENNLGKETFVEVSYLPYSRLYSLISYGEKEFYIGVAECMRTKYNKADIQSIEWQEGNIMEITMQNGKKIKKNYFSVFKR